MLSTNDKCDLAEAKLKAFTRSAIRTKVMLCLLEDEQDACKLGNEIGVRPTTIHHSIKGMIKENLVAKNDIGYELTNTGRIQAIILEKLVSTSMALNPHRDFWLDHDISGIPLELQKNIGMLSQSEIVASDSFAPLRTHENFLADLDRAKEIYGVSPVIYPGDSDAIARAIKKGINVNLILTNEILEIVVENYADLGDELLREDNFRLYSTDAEVKEAFTVTDTILSLGLFRLNGNYDTGNDLICKGDMARRWGMELFNHYLNISKRVHNI